MLERSIRWFGRTPHWRGKSRLERLLEGLPTPTTRVHTFHPYRFAMRIDWSNELERSMYVRDLEPDTTWLLSKILPGQSSFWDVGANLGFFSLYASHVAGVPSISAFEPSPSTVQALERNISLNRNRAISVYPFALGRHSGNHSLYSHHSANHGMNSLFGDTGQSPLAQINVHAADSLISDGVPIPDVIKIDIEGGEVDFFLGAQQLIERSRPRIIVEISRPTLERAGHTPEVLVQMVRDLGYRVYFPWKRTLESVAGKELPHELLLGRGHGSNYFLDAKTDPRGRSDLLLQPSPA